jgi:demethylmenaquinone methyltransferase/2-methoxy-6-polyprenyl-1,4-benzoquinol methylase
MPQQTTTKINQPKNLLKINKVKQNKQKTIINMFDDIANTYDKANAILSGGIDKIWRKNAIKKALQDKFFSNNKISILDVACGSGDMIANWQIQTKAKKLNAKIQGFDASVNMLKIAKKRFTNLEFKQGDCALLPYKNNSFDYISISYGIRNVVKIDNAISEFYRVLKPNGSLVILEFMNNLNPSIKDKILGIYINKIMPFFGGLISNNKKAYSYLSNSINDFITKDELKKKLIKNKFATIYNTSGFLNISTTFIVTK